jgi:hypothetical protein
MWAAVILACSCLERTNELHICLVWFWILMLIRIVKKMTQCFEMTQIRMYSMYIIFVQILLVI